MDYNEEEDNIENLKRSRKESIPSEQTTFSPNSEAYYAADNRVLIPETESVTFKCFKFNGNLNSVHFQNQ